MPRPRRNFCAVSSNVPTKSNDSWSFLSPRTTTHDASMSTAELPLIPLPVRPGFGKAGKPIRLRANHFALDIKSVPKLSLYHVTMVPPVQKTTNGTTTNGNAKPSSSQDAARSLPPRLCRAVVRDLSLKQKWPAIAYDGATQLLAPSGAIPGADNSSGVELVVPRPTDIPGEGDFTVKVKYSGTIDITASLDAHARGETPGVMPAAALQALDAVMRQERANDPSWVVVGRGFLNGSSRKRISGGFEVWLGYTQSTRPTQGGTHLVIDRVAAAFIAHMSAVERLCTVLDSGGGTGGGGRGGRGGRGPSTSSNPTLPQLPLRKRDFDIANAAFKGIRVTLTHFPGQKRRKQVRGFSKVSAGELFFKDDNNRKVNVVTYFKSKYPNVGALNPKLPCLIAGTSQKPIHFPMEVCDVPEQQKRLLEDAKATADMIRATATPPVERRAAIEQTVRQHVATPTALHKKGFSVGVGKDMVSVQGRVLNPPMVVYKNNKIATPSRGAWNLNDHVLLDPPPVPLMKWALVTLDSSIGNDSLKDLGEQLRSGMRKFGGFRDPGAAALDGVRNRGEPVENAVRRAASKGATLVVCVLSPFDTTRVYNCVKSAAELDIGVQTQCLINKWRLGQGGGESSNGGGGERGGRGGRGGRGCQPQSGPNDQVIANIVQKINAKLGGRNAKVTPSVNDRSLMKIPTLIYGADVSHAAPGSTLNSVAAVVGNTDDHCARYVARLSSQASRVEVIEDLELMASEIALNFYRSNGQTKPKRVIFYRDGVSESQFQIVLNDELKALRKAFAKLGDGTYNPPVTFVVAQKRHKTRLFVENPGKDGDGRNGNVPAGTVVDTNICHATEHDFFLQSHAGIRGTTRSVHYHVLCDENGFGADAIQGLTFALSHLYSRCTRSVSLVPPVYYAHLAAARGTAFAKAAEASDTSSTVSGGTQLGVDADATPIVLHRALNDKMYFV